MNVLQGVAGNAAVQRMLESSTFVGQPAHGSGSGEGVTVHGETVPHFDGGTGTVVDRRVTRGRTCTDCPEGKCVHVKGTLMLNYHMDVDIIMPDVPPGLSECKTARFRTFINTTLRDHENEHKRRFETYNGTRRIPFDLTECGQEDIQSKLQELHDDDAQKRADRAQALSDDLDNPPFNKKVDLSGCGD